MIDIGVNLLHDQFDADRGAVLQRAWQAGLTHIVITGTDLETSAAAADFVAADASGRTSATAGIHPHDAARAPSDWRDRLRPLLQRPGVVAVGETGLDFNRNFSPPADQQALFRGQLQLAAGLDLPVFVHDREASDEVAAGLREDGDPTRAAVHCFTGTRDALLRYLELGCWIGITGWVCDERRGGELQRLVPEIPLERLLVETDAPFLRPRNAPRDTHGRRNEPALLPWVIRRLARLYECEEAEVARITAANARRFFRLAAA
jgi:TatD DNase family protein